MEPEGVVNALRNVHRMLVPRGILLDLHPIAPPDARAESHGVDLGALDQRVFAETVRQTEAGLEAAVRRGLFAPETRRELDVIERFETADELLETVGAWKKTRIPPDVAKRIRAADPPVDVRERLVLRRLRARYSSGATGSPTRTRPGSSTSP
jgi:hypothetical protein